MPLYKLRYGEETVEFEYGPGRLEPLLPDPPRKPLGKEDIRSALRNPVESPPLRKLARGRKSALIVISDATRIVRSDVLVPLLLEELATAGMESGKVKVVVALGNHRRATDEEVAALLGPALGKVKVVQHDSRDLARLHLFGRTGRGTEVRLSKLLLEHDLVVTASMINFHYAAGFTGGRKAILPGLAWRDTIVANHLLSVDFERGTLAEGVASGSLSGNPMHEDMDEAVAMHPPDFSVNVILTPEHEIGTLWAGDWRASHRGACGVFLKRFGVPVPELKPVVIASAGGHPKDIDFIQSNKTIQFATRALEPGGTLILLARCGEGIGNPHFEGFFPLDDVKEFLRRLKLENPRNGQTALALRSRTQEYRVVLVTKLPAEKVRDMGMEHASSIEQALALVSGGEDGYIIPEGGLTLPLPKQVLG